METHAPPPLALGPRPDRVGHAARQAVLTSGRWTAVMLGLGAATILVMAVCLQFGAERIGVGEIARILLHAAVGDRRAVLSESVGVIVLEIRLPRVLLGFLVGSCLAGVGVALQALLRNPLADPYVLGISSGAALGAAVAVLLGAGTSWLGAWTLPAFAFGGGLLAILLVYRIAVSYGRLPVHTLLLAGVILNAVFSALIMFITSLVSPAQSFAMLAWLMGTLNAPDHGALAILTAYLVVGGLVLLRQARVLDLLTLGEDGARSLGVEVESVKKTLFFTSALLTGAVVSQSGMIGFIGMVVPHAVRLVLGADHRLLLPASALVGGAFLVAADTLARTLLAPGEMPVGVVTALVGGPFFLYLLMRKTAGLGA
jgi:iron complex transport system permease protein